MSASLGLTVMLKAALPGGMFSGMDILLTSRSMSWWAFVGSATSALFATCVNYSDWIRIRNFIKFVYWYSVYIITSIFSAKRVGTGPMMLSPLNMVQTRGHSFTSTVGTLSLKQKKIFRLYILLYFLRCVNQVTSSYSLVVSFYFSGKINKFSGSFVIINFI